MTDIEGSTRRWAEDADAMRAGLARHDAVLREAIESHGGWLFRHTRDGVVAAFAAQDAALGAAIAAQRRLELPVRMGICTGPVETRGDDYFGPALNRAARILEAGHGGQVLVAEATAVLIDGAELIGLGEYRLRDLLQPQRLWQARSTGLRDAFPPLRTLDAVLGNLPVQATSLLGREREVAGIVAVARLAEAKLVTLTGIGGVGKTRLSLQAAAEASRQFPDGAWFVPLAAVTDPAATAHAVAAVVGVTQQTGRTVEQSVAAALVGRRLLLVLDNCEHLIDEASSVERAIIDQCPRVRLLATSREALAIAGEQIYPVSPLGLGDGAASPRGRVVHRASPRGGARLPGGRCHRGHHRDLSAP